MYQLSPFSAVTPPSYLSQGKHQCIFHANFISEDNRITEQLGLDGLQRSFGPGIMSS